MVELSDTGDLMAIMAALKCPRAFVFGEQNSHLSYIGDLPGIDVETVEIPHSGHFPMYSNPPVLWTAMANFLAKHEKCV